MAKLELTKTRLQAGVWEGVLAGAGAQAPQIEVTHQTTVIDGVEITPDPKAKGRFSVRVPIPASALSDGIQTFLISDKASGAVLNSFTILAGDPLDEDQRNELNLMRAELDLLKSAFRRHCVETT